MADIVDLLKKLKDDIPSGMRVCMPAKIESYDFKTQKASVKIDMLDLYDDGDTEDFPVVSGVPVVFMASGGASINLPVLKGDTCFIIFFDRDMSNWLLGGTGKKPNSTRTHDLSDAVAIMGLSPFTKISKAENNTDVLINYSGSKITIKPDGILNIETTKDININSAEVINMNSKNINIKAIEDITVNCKNATLTAEELITSTSKNANITTSEDITVTCKNSNITVNETATLTSKNVVIENSELVTLNSNNVTIENGELITVNSKNININTGESINVNCVDAVITATNEIKTTSIKFIQTGDMSISGNLELGGHASGLGGDNPVIFNAGITNTGDINNDGDIKNFGNIVNNGGQVSSGIVVLDSHVHTYVAPSSGGAPAPTTTPIPG